MFKTVLVPIAEDMVTPKVMKQIATLLGADGGSVVLTYVSDPRAPFIYTRKASEYKISDANHKKACAQHAKMLLEKASKLIGGAIKVKTLHEYNPTVYEGILEAAKKASADVIMMASHKRVGLKGAFMGSDTHAVIIHSKLPVIVI
jgi:nucleotide-binding universal stress UspA family protein